MPARNPVCGAQSQIGFYYPAGQKSQGVRLVPATDTNSSVA
jgi:hypothetical protein